MQTAVKSGNMLSAKMKTRRRVRASQIAVHAVIIVLLFLVLFPFYILIVNSFKLPKDIFVNPFSFPGTPQAPLVLTAFGTAWGYIKNYLLNTVIIAVLEIAGTLLFASMAAYGFSRFKFAGKNIVFTVFLAFMMIPGILTLAPQYALVYNNLRLGQTMAGVILPAIAGGMPTGVFLIRTFFSGVPDSVFEAAELDGAGHIRRYLTLALPLSMPILFTIGLSTLLGAWNDIIWARLILYGKENLYTISVGVFVSFNSSVNKSITDTVVYAGYCIASLPLVLVFALTSKQFIKGLTSGAIKM
ncbi:MAG: carbohydrate ABC transporter permease [Clostridia bacterium]|nr:carbohydrate ABC transporter permease [Clostridia bacterium]